MMVIITMMKMPTMMMTFSVVKSDGTSDVGKCSQIDRTSIRVSRRRTAAQCCAEFLFFFLFVCLFARVFLFLSIFFRKLTARQSGSVVGEKKVSDLNFFVILKEHNKVSPVQSHKVRT